MLNERPGYDACIADNRDNPAILGVQHENHLDARHKPIFAVVGKDDPRVPLDPSPAKSLTSSTRQARLPGS
jgi:hypothetical protein